MWNIWFHHTIFQHIPAIQHTSAILGKSYTLPPSSQVQTFAPHPQRVGHLHGIGGASGKPQQGAVGKACLTVQGEIVEGHVQIIFWGGLSFVLFFVHDSWGLKCLPLKMLFDVPFLNYRWAFWRHVHVLCEHRSGHCKPKAHQTSTLFVLVLVSNLLFVFRISSNIARDSHDAKIAGLYSLEVFVGSSAILLLPPALTVANIFWLLLGTYSFVSALSQNGGHASIAFYHFLWGKKMRWLFYDWG